MNKIKIVFIIQFLATCTIVKSQNNIPFIGEAFYSCFGNYHVTTYSKILLFNRQKSVYLSEEDSLYYENDSLYYNYTNNLKAGNYPKRTNLSSGNEGLATAVVDLSPGLYGNVPALYKNRETQAVKEIYIKSSPAIKWFKQTAPAYYTIIDSMPAIKWQMLEGQKNIAGLQCKKAQGYFRGRTWVAWYTESIPVNDGPWKLCGLPGLILEATEANGLAGFSVKKIIIKNAGLPYVTKELIPLKTTTVTYKEYSKIYEEDKDKIINYLKADVTPLAGSLTTETEVIKSTNELELPEQ